MGKSPRPPCLCLFYTISQSPSRIEPQLPTKVNSSITCPRSAPFPLLSYFPHPPGCFHFPNTFLHSNPCLRVCSGVTQTEALITPSIPCASIRKCPARSHQQWSPSSSRTFFDQVLLFQHRHSTPTPANPVIWGKISRALSAAEASYPAHPDFVGRCPIRDAPCTSWMVSKKAA